MISIDVDRTNPLHWLTGLALLIALAVPVWLIIRNRTLRPRRRAVRLLLNGLLWFVLVGYVLQPAWPVQLRTSHTLLVGADVPGTFWRSVRDSLRAESVTTAQTFRADRVWPDPVTPDRFDSVTLVGQGFTPELLSHLSQQTVRWIPYKAPDQLQTIHWQGILRQGERQQVSGTLQSSKKQTIMLTYAGRTLDSVKIPAGPASFRLQFPAFARGQTAVTLLLDRQPVDTIRFFTQPGRPLTYQFLLDTPDFESKTLAEWLGKQGNAVQLDAVVSRSVSNRLTINRVGGKADVVITDPTHAADPVIRRAVAEGRAVLFMNLTNPEVDVRTINRALGGRWSARKISNEPMVRVAEGLTALPYAFSQQNRQFDVMGYPVAVQPIGGWVGVSLLNETFPLKLSGDSLAYDRVWYSLLALLRPPSANTVRAEAPLFRSLRETLTVTNAPAKPKTIQAGADTVALVQSPLNDQSAAGTALFSRSGWQTTADSLALYVEGSGFATVRQNQIVQAYVAAHAADRAGRHLSKKTAEFRIPNGVWLVLFLLGLTGLWIEPKWSY